MTVILPPTNTKIRILKNIVGFNAGDIAYVAGYTHSPASNRPPGDITVSDEPGQFHGYFARSGEWEVFKDNPFSLTDDQINDIVRSVLEAARKRGYCGETRNILSDLGLPTSPLVERTYTVTVKVPDEENPVFSVDSGTIVKSESV